VLPPAAAVVANEVAELRSESSAAGDVVVELKRDDYLTVLETDGDWFYVETDNRTRGWIEIAAVEVVPPRDSDAATPDAATPVTEASPVASPVAATPASS
jgi:hypothetical protein